MIEFKPQTIDGKLRACSRLLNEESANSKELAVFIVEAMVVVADETKNTMLTAKLTGFARAFQDHFVFNKKGNVVA